MVHEVYDSPVFLSMSLVSPLGGDEYKVNVMKEGS